MLLASPELEVLDVLGSPLEVGFAVLWLDVSVDDTGECSLVAAVVPASEQATNNT